MQFLGDGNTIMSIAKPEDVSKVTILNRSFFYIKNYFVELLTEGPVSLYSRIHQQRNAEKIGAYGGASPSSSIQSVSTFHSSDGRIDNLTPNEVVNYITSISYYLVYNGKTKLVFNQNDLLKCFPSKKEELKKELDKENTKFNSTDSVKKIVEWMNANGINN